MEYAKTSVWDIPQVNRLSGRRRHCRSQAKHVYRHATCSENPLCYPGLKHKCKIKLIRHALDPEPIPGTLRTRWEYTHRTPLDTFPPSHSQLGATQHSTCLLSFFLRSGRNPDNLKETHSNPSNIVGCTQENVIYKVHY